VVAVARSGSFTAAAQAVGVTQSAVTKSVADIERQLGYSLFHRTSRGVLMTEKGLEFVERASLLLGDAHDLLNGSSVAGDAFAGELRIGVCPASLEWCLIPPIATLLARHPSIRVNVSGSSFERMVQQVRTGAVDVAVGFDAAFSEWPELRREPMAELKTALFVRNDHPLAGRQGLTPSDLANFDFVSPSDSRPYGAVIRDIYESQGVQWNKRIHILDYFPLVERVVATTNAIGVVAVSYARSASFRKQFTTIEKLDLFPPSPMCCAFRLRWEPKPAVRALIRAVRDELSALANTEQ